MELLWLLLVHSQLQCSSFCWQLLSTLRLLQGKEREGFWGFRSWFAEDHARLLRTLVTQSASQTPARGGDWRCGDWGPSWLLDPDLASPDCWLFCSPDPAQSCSIFLGKHVVLKIEFWEQTCCMFMTRNLSSIKSLKMQGFSQPGGLSSPRKAEPACLLDGGVHTIRLPGSGLHQPLFTRRKWGRPSCPALARCVDWLPDWLVFALGGAAWAWLSPWVSVSRQQSWSLGSGEEGGPGRVGVCFPWRGGTGLWELALGAPGLAWASSGEWRAEAGLGQMAVVRRYFGHRWPCGRVQGLQMWVRVLSPRGGLARPWQGHRLKVRPSCSASVGLLGRRIEPYPDVESSFKFSTS